MRGMIIIIAAILTASFALTGCDYINDLMGKEQEALLSAPVELGAALVPKKFAPPADSAVNDRQFGTWKECGALLDSLTYFYADSFKTADAVQMLRLQEDFMKAKDKLCRRAGMAGGFDEYKWVSQSLGHPKNKKHLSEDAFF